MNVHRSRDEADFPEQVARQNAAFDPGKMNFRELHISSSGGQKEAEGVIILKPEICKLREEFVHEIVSYLAEMAVRSQVDIKGVYSFSGKFLLKQNTIQENYHHIHRHASTCIASRNAVEFFLEQHALAGMTNVSAVYGGLFASRYFLSKRALFDLWVEHKSDVVKIGDDCYGLTCRIGSRDCLLLNGFYPYQVSLYSGQNSKIIAMTYETDESHHLLKRYFQGDADTSKAEPASIRQFLNRNQLRYGITDFGTSLNGIHLSADPVDGCREVHLIRRAAIAAAPLMDVSPELARL
jgi:hypothetical protein